MRVVIVLGLFILGFASCKRESMADYVPLDKDTINNPPVGSFNLDLLYDKVWSGYSSNDEIITYQLIFYKDKTLFSLSQYYNLRKGETCEWSFISPNIIKLSTTKMIDNKNVSGTWKIDGDENALYLTRGSESLKLYKQ